MKTKYGNWTILEEKGKDANGCRLMLCQCACGKKRLVRLINLRFGSTKSCGCVGRLSRIKANTFHGHSTRTFKSTEYRAWSNAKTRCTLPSHRSFKNYGGRGIKMCERWSQSFLTFLADMGSKPPKASLDRIDPNGDYEPSNCRWASRVQQANNTTKNVIIESNGIVGTASDWARKLNFNPHTLRQRIRRSKWGFEKALSTPVNPNHTQ